MKKLIVHHSQLCTFESLMKENGIEYELTNWDEDCEVFCIELTPQNRLLALSIMGIYYLSNSQK